MFWLLYFTYYDRNKFKSLHQNNNRMIVLVMEIDLSYYSYATCSTMTLLTNQQYDSDCITQLSLCPPNPPPLLTTHAQYYYHYVTTLGLGGLISRQHPFIRKLPWLFWWNVTKWSTKNILLRMYNFSRRIWLFWHAVIIRIFTHSFSEHCQNMLTYGNFQVAK